MALLLKLLIAHIVSDFIFQPTRWIEDKNKRKFSSPALYGHIGVHAIILALLLGFDIRYWLGYTIIIVSHFAIDLGKTYLNKKYPERYLFFFDQAIHLIIIVLVVYWYFPFQICWNTIWSVKYLWLYNCLLMVTFGSAVMVKVVVQKWYPVSEESNKDSLEDAGWWIGILERLFVFGFIVTGHWEAIGFLLAAKSVFRFGHVNRMELFAFYPLP